MNPSLKILVGGQRPLFLGTPARARDLERPARSHSFGVFGLLRRLGQSTIGLLTRCWLRIETEGLENLPQSGTFVIAANHCSHLDSLVVREAARSRCHVRFVGARDYFFRGPILRAFARWFLDVIPIDRRPGAIAGLRECLRLLTTTGHAREALLLFPEGTRSPSGQMQAFRPGLGLLAVESRVPVVPAWISGTFDLLPRGSLCSRRGRVRVVFGRSSRAADIPFSGRPRSHDHFQAIVRQVQQDIVELSRNSK